MDKKMNDDDSQFPEAELARLADGSLPAARQAELEAELRRSPDLSRVLAEQEQALSLVRAVDVPAPDSLRRWLETQVHETQVHEHQVDEHQVDEQPEKSPKRRRSWGVPRFAFVGAIGVAAAAVAAAVVIAVGGGSSGPTLGQAAHAALAASTMPAPSEAGARTLDVSAAGIPFPYWADTVGWRARGLRIDSLAGRRAVTVYYTNSGRRVGYTIVTGPPLHVSGGVPVIMHGIPYTFMRVGSTRLITWRRNGHTCVIAGQGVTYTTLRKLATAEFLS
jgi:hypothetical protein